MDVIRKESELCDPLGGGPGSGLGALLRKLTINLVPFPRLHFLICGFDPQNMIASTIFRGSRVRARNRSAFREWIPNVLMSSICDMTVTFIGNTGVCPLVPEPRVRGGTVESE
jgi:hypothetical protein